MTDQEITIALAEKVMGWHSMSNLPSAFGDLAGKFVHWCENWSPLTDWRDAMELAERWHATVVGGGNFDLDKPLGSKEWRCEISDYGDMYFLYKHACGPRAVTLAVAKAIGLDV